MNQKIWQFPVNGGGLAAGFNDSSIDHFKGHRLSSLVREVIQNSIDARKSSSEPVVVDFQFGELSAESLPELTSLVEHFKCAQQTAELQGSEQAIDFYNDAIAVVEQKRIPFLSIHDSNTTGLTGPLEGPHGAWYALTKGSGLTQNKAGASLGSFGHGSKAPFVSSKLRTIFYLSNIEQPGSVSELRFQGKSILQSYKLPNGEMTQGTGFFGDPDRCQPLTNAEVPHWAKELRTSRTEATGTSIIIPGTIWSQQSIDSVTITAVSNFFYAIWKGALVVQVGEAEQLTAQNIVEKFKSFKPRLSDVFEEIDMEAISDAFDSIETVVSPTQKGEQQIQTFGRIDWYFRVGDEVESRNVAVARGNGMLITKRAPNLIKFPNLKPFDFFVCVTGNGGDGSELLKSIENPEHTNFEFDRIDDHRKRAQAKKNYESFHKAIREIVKRFASYSSSDQIVVDDLQDLFNDISDDIEAPGGSVERGSKIQIANGGFVFKKREDSSSGNIPDENGLPAQTGSRGDRSGKKRKQSEGGTMPSDVGPATVIGPSQPRNDGPEPPKTVPLRNLRMRLSNTHKNTVTLFFDTPFIGDATLKLTKAGEVSGEPICFLLDGKPTANIDIKLSKTSRTEVTVDLADMSVDYAIEGEAYEVKS